MARSDTCPTLTNESLTILTVNIRGLRNKTDQIKKLIKKYQPDFVLLQETFVHKPKDQKSMEYLLLPEVRNPFWGVRRDGKYDAGIAILKTSNKWSTGAFQHDNEGRLGSLEIQCGSQKHLLVCVYGDVSHHPEYDIFKHIPKFVGHRGDYSVIMGGDFNAILNLDDSTSSRKAYQIKLPKAENLRQTLERLGLTDTYKEYHPLSSDSTSNPTGQEIGGSRIDKFYAPHDVLISECTHLKETLAFTDHKAVKVTYHTEDTRANHRSAYWKFNSNLLKNSQYVHAVSEILENYKIEAQHTPVTSFWDILKRTMKSTAIWFSKKQQKEYRTKEKELKEFLDQHSEKEEQQHYTSAKEELRKLKQTQLVGCKIRCTVKGRICPEENLTDKVKRLENTYQGRKQIPKIRDNTGVVEEDPKKIADSFRGFYMTLYGSEPVDDRKQTEYTRYAKSLSAEDSQELDQPIALADLKASLEQTENNKAPGPDGLTFEFYKGFFHLLGPLLLQLVGEIHQTGSLTQSQTLSYITLLPKVPGPPLDMAKYRPISLLNSDYKLITKTLANKIKPMLGKLIDKDQTCNIKGRSIEQHTHFLRDYIHINKNRRSSAIILSIDQEKAFDRLEHSYIQRCLEACNIGNYYRTWIEILYREPKSSVLANGIISETFEIQRSVRQGCPLSALLYILCLENLLEAIRQDENIKGTQLPGIPNKKLLAYADDTTLFPENAKSVDLILEKFKDFGQASGSKINIHKTKAMHVGTGQNPCPKSDIEWVDSMKILGIKYHKDTIVDKSAWQACYHSMENLVSDLTIIPTNIIERINMVNTYVLPKALYLIKIWDPGSKSKNKLKNLITRFVNNFRTLTLPYEVLITPRDEGGMGLQDLDTKIKASTVKYIKKTIGCPGEYQLARYYLGRRTQKFAQQSLNVPAYGGNNPPKIYQLSYKLIKDHENLFKDNHNNKVIYKTVAKDYSEMLELTAGISINKLKEGTKNTHNKILSGKTQELTFKLIYDRLPLVKGRTCCLCHKHINNNSRHIFLECHKTTKVREITMRSIEFIGGDEIHGELAIRHNIFNIRNHILRDTTIALLGVYRMAIWHCTIRSHLKTTHISSGSILAEYNRLMELEGERLEYTKCKDVWESISQHITDHINPI